VACGAGSGKCTGSIHGSQDHDLGASVRRRSCLNVNPRVCEQPFVAGLTLQSPLVSLVAGMLSR
jgi:hypothetical protein